MIRKIWPYLVSAGSAIGVVLAFFIPSIQDQWDRYQSRHVIQQYVEMGNEFMKEEKYTLAEESYSKAYELSEQKRLDIEVKRLSAKVYSIYLDPVWGSRPPEGLEDVDFQFLLHLQKKPEHFKERASILTTYGIYLAALGKLTESKKAMDESIRLDPHEAVAYINLGNLLDQMGKKQGAGQAYRRALEINPNNIRAHYNLGLLYGEQNNLTEAQKEFEHIIRLDPRDSDAKVQLSLIHRERKKL